MPYFDFNATAPLHPDARRAWLEASDRAWHNPSSLFAGGTFARNLLEDARERLADLLGCDAERIVFTSGATAANNAVARHVGRTAAGRRAVISAVEHPCVRDAFVAAMPGSVVEAPLDRDGVVSIDAVEELLAAGDVACVSVMAAGNESGVIQPWQLLAERCRQRGVDFHTDAAQWLGKLPAAELGRCDWVTGSGHKFGGPKGVGFLVVPEGRTGFHGDLGGPQERGRWAGTENVAAIVAMVAALEARDGEAAGQRLLRAGDRDAAERRLLAAIPAAIVVGGGAPRLWNTLAVIVPGADGKKLVARLGRAGVDASTGSACSTGSDSLPRAVLALGGEAAGRGMVRLSGGWETTAADWTVAIDALVAASVTDRADGASRPAPGPRR